LRWESLNGPWDFIFDDEDVGLTQAWHRTGIPAQCTTNDPNIAPQDKRVIQVPFVFQAPASGINVREVHEVLWYEREISDQRTYEERDEGYRLLLRFGAVDYHAKVWLDGICVGEHSGGHVPFDLDITDAIDLRPAPSYRLTIRVFDSATDRCQPRGKQYWGPKPESIFYTPSSGIWQTVWLEAVPGLRIQDSSHGTILRSHDIEGGVLHAQVATSWRPIGKAYIVEVQVSFAGMIINTERRSIPGGDDTASFDIAMALSEEQKGQLPPMLLLHAPLHSDQHWRNNVALWAPEHPLLYDLKIRLYDANDRLVDEVQTTTGMRSLQWTMGDGTFRLNGQPYFQALVLDQGYWPQTLLSPPAGALKYDIELAKSMGESLAPVRMTDLI
jgi:beta-galactosidase/beta-glucuronidase